MLPPVFLLSKFKAYTGTVGTLSKFADCLNSSHIADLTFFLKDVDHLRGVKHQPHSILDSSSASATKSVVIVSFILL